MLSSFIDREKEIQDLSTEYESNKSSFVVLYGRRRIGKTSLISKFIQGKDYIYFLADTRNEELQLVRFQELLMQKYNDNLLKNIKISSWDGIFDYLANKITDKKLVIIVDEFSYLYKSDKTISSVFQRIWDQKLKDRNVMLILCGSLIHMMYDASLSINSPLYGRNTMQMKLQPLDFENYRKFFPKRTNKEILEFYAVTGGVPKYIELLNNKEKIIKNIKTKILDKNSSLYNEPRIILKDEINEPTTFFSILQIISAGDHKIGNIASKLEMQAKDMTSILDKLRDLEIIERLVPITETNPSKSRMGLYFIKDNFFNFWFRYVFANQEELEIGNMDIVIDKIQKDFSFYTSFIFESVCIEFVRKNKIMFNLQRVGKYWSNNNEIDVVGIGDTKILFGECKWTNEKIDRRILEDLRNRSQEVVQKYKNMKPIFALFSKSGFSKELKDYSKENKDIYLFSIEDLFK